MDEWVSNANEALEICLVQPASTGGLRTVASFHPQFTYPIFGDEETIFGYQGLKIQLRYHASDMRPNLQVSCDKKFKSVGENEPTDIVQALQSSLPPVAFQKASEFEQALRLTDEAASSFHPPGERIREFETSDGRYEIWKGSLADLAVKQLVDRIQILVTLFIEGGSFISTDGASDPLDRWTLFFLYRTRQRPGSASAYDYEFAGYSTVYRFLLPVGPRTPPHSAVSGEGGHAKNGQSSTASSTLEQLGGEPAFSLATLPCRSRLSQFVILPPFQHKGNAGRLYSTIFSHYLEEPQTVELTVEDPNEAFDDVRDLADLHYLTTAVPSLDHIVRIDTSVAIPKTGPSPRNIAGDPAALDALRHQTKIAPRQFHRLVEMLLMRKLTPSLRPNLDEFDEQEEEEHAGGKRPAAAAAPALAPATKEQEHEYKLWRLFVKQRLYRHNKEILGQLERGQRIDKLEETLRSVELEYARILSLFESREKLQEKEKGGRKQGASVPTPAPEATATKRKLVDDDDDDGYVSSSSKKARTSKA